MDLQVLVELIKNGELDPQTIQNLANTPPEEIRALMSKYLRDDELDDLLARIDQLVEAQRQGTP